MARDDEDSIFEPGVIVRIQYGCYLLVGFLATTLFTTALSTALEKFSFLRVGCTLIDSDILRTACTGEMMAYRVSFALVVFFAMHWLSVSDLTCCMRSKARAELQTRFFTFKTFVLVALFLTTFLIPNGFFVGYAYVCLFCSAIFLLMNVVFLVDFSYQWSDDWGERADSNSKWLWYLLIVAVGSLLIGLAITIASVVFFVPHADCNFNAFAVTSVVGGAVVYTALSVWVPHGSIVPSAIVFLYTSSIMFVTLRTGQDTRCNRLALAPGESAGFFQMFVAIVPTSFMLGWTAVSSGGSGAALNVGLDDDGDDEDPDRAGHLSHFMFFYFIMIMGSMYLAMLATNWHVSGAGEKTVTQSVNIAFWVRGSTVWLAVFLYVWSLVAPYTCCKDRDFGFSTEEDWV